MNDILKRLGIQHTWKSLIFFASMTFMAAASLGHLYYVDFSAPDRWYYTAIIVTGWALAATVNAFAAGLHFSDIVNANLLTSQQELIKEQQAALVLLRQRLDNRERQLQESLNVKQHLENIIETERGYRCRT